MEGQANGPLYILWTFITHSITCEFLTFLHHTLRFQRNYVAILPAVSLTTGGHLNGI